MRILLFALIVTGLLCGTVCGQDTGGAFDLVDEIANTGKPSVAASDIVAGFSMWGLAGGLLFGGIGFVALVYGKKTSRFRPMLIGIFLIMLPYFTQSSLILYPVGISLVLMLYLAGR